MINEYERKGAVFEGEWGVAPNAIYDYFEEHGYDVNKSTDFEMEDINSAGEMYDTIIISMFNNQDRVTAQIHTVNISKKGGLYYIHNDYYTNESNDYVEKGPYDSLWETVMNLSKGNAKPICIIGINQKEGESN